MKKGLVVLIIIVLGILLVACGGSTSLKRDTETVDRQQQVYQINQPVPFFKWSKDRDVLIQIYEAKNKAQVTWSVVASYGTGEPRFICPSIGFAIPADTQLTNPLQPTYPDYRDSAVVDQAEPNGLYSSKNTDGTYVLCVRDNGDVVPIYTELKVTTYPFPVKWNPQSGMIEEVEGEPSTITVDLNRARVVTDTQTQ
jgi:hypothetical protein